MIFVVQTAGGRDCTELVKRLRAQSHEYRSAVPSVAVVPDIGNEGQLRGMFRALALVMGHGAVTLLEDDVEICEGFVPYVCERWSYAPWPVVRWYAPGDLPRTRRPRGGFVSMPGGRYKCNQAVTIRADIVNGLARCSFTTRRLNETDRHSGDALIAEYLDSIGYSFAQHLPGLVQHMGGKSLVTANRNPLRDRFHEGPYHTSHNYIGRDGDPRKAARDV